MKTLSERLKFITLLILPLGSSLAIDMYLPAYQDIAREYMIDEGWVNISMGIYLLGLAIGQLIYGPMSDKYGRKPPLLFGLSLFLLATIGCQFAPNYPIFLLMRLLQALGACAAIVLVRAIVMDSYGAKLQLRLLALISAINIFSPALAPLIGGIMLKWVSWHMIFASIAGYALVTLLLTYYLITESHASIATSVMSVTTWMRTGRQLFANRTFSRYVLCIAVLYGMAFIWVTLSPIIVLEQMHVSQAHFGLVFMMQCLGNTSGSLLAAILISERSLSRIIKLGFSVLPLSALGFLALKINGLLMLAPLMMLVVTIYFAIGIVQPALTQAALALFSEYRGFAAGVLGSLQASFGLLTTLITGEFYEAGAMTMAVMLLIYSLAALYLLPRVSKPAEYIPEQPLSA